MKYLVKLNFVMHKDVIFLLPLSITQFQTLVDFQFEMNSIPISEYVLHPFLDDMSVVK